MIPEPLQSGSTSPQTRSLAYKQLFIQGRQICAGTLYGMYMSLEEPISPEQIAREYDLPVEAVEEAIAYCQTDPPKIKADLSAKNESCKRRA